VPLTLSGSSGLAARLARELLKWHLHNPKSVKSGIVTVRID
jgi:hypothetical protein